MAPRNRDEGSVFPGFDASPGDAAALIESLAALRRERGMSQTEVAARMGDYPALGKAAARRIHGARLFEIAEAGHLPQVDSFQKYVRALLEFIAVRSGNHLSPTHQG